MEDIKLYASLTLVSLLVAYKLYKSITSHKNLPPSPPSIPILGHLHLVKPPAHRTFHRLSLKYGPIMSLKFGSRLVVIVSSPSAVEECFTKNDIVLANRPRLTQSKYIGYNSTTISSSPYGDHWRNVRRIASIEIFSSHRLNMFVNIRKDETKRFLLKLARDSQPGFAKVEMKSRFSDLTFNITMRMVAGKRYFDDEDVTVDKQEARQFKELIVELFRLAGASNPQDFSPFLKWINGASFEREFKKLTTKSDRFLQSFIDEHRQNQENGLQNNTMIDHLLSLQQSQPDYYSDTIIKGLVNVIVLAGTDTSAATLEWAMANLINHPNVLEKARKELETQIGQERLIEESDLSKLPYLQSVILETLRLYPPTPLLLPHCASEDCTIGGYNVPSNTIVLVNSWTIHRDPNVWEEAETFKPERFESGQQPGDTYKLMPFGIGRRACPGTAMAQRVVGLTLGSLIQCFDWKRVDKELVDMNEGTGLTMPKADPLVALCKPRHIMQNVRLDNVVA